MSRIVSFRGLLANGLQDTVSLHTTDGATGYRIKSLRLIASVPATTTQESIVKIFKVDGKPIDAIIDFSDNTLVAAGYFEGHSNSTTFGGTVIVFDNEIFNQDIFIMGIDGSGSAQPINYYIELEQMPLDLNENTVATLKDIRNQA